ncbi:MAG TPA: 2-dehydro-3-deoxygluconokinase, partial [Clostridiales bacterium]|nr:2-dehydro-3-deoxygluconokinase [Clostridiales bacterium]
MKKIVGFGDLLLSLSPVGYRKFTQADSMEVNYTGAEANVCVSLARFGMDVDFVTRVPNNDIAECAVAMLRKFNVGTSKIVTGGDRLGLIYTEKGASQRSSRVVYDRKPSSFSTAKIGDFDWDAIFSNAEWFHFTGITVALSDSCAALCKQACIAARARGIRVSCDLNYRKNLWNREKTKSDMEELVCYCDLLIGNEEDADKVLSIKAADTDVIAGKLSRVGYEDVARQICSRFGVKQAAFTLRESISASDNNWSAMFYQNGEAYFSKKYAMHIVNRVGGGDAFTAGLIYALMNSYEPQRAVEFATAASCLKHTIELDFNLVTLDEVEKLAGGDGSGRVQP